MEAGDRGPEHLTLREASDLVRLSPSTLRRMADRGEFPSLIRVSPRRWIVSRAAVLRWLEDRRERPGEVTAWGEAIRDSTEDLPPLPRRRSAAGGSRRTRA